MAKYPIVLVTMVSISFGLLSLAPLSASAVHAVHKESKLSVTLAGGDQQRDDDPDDTNKVGEMSKAKLNHLCPCATGRDDRFDVDDDDTENGKPHKARGGS